MKIKKIVILIVLYLLNTNILHSIEADIFVQSTVNRASKILSDSISKEEKIKKLKSVAEDTVDIKGIGFYEHAETPGLGGEVDNVLWKNQWVGKLALDENHHPIFAVSKGAVTKGSPGYESKVDGLSGATITSNGVTGLVQYWLGEDGFGPYLAKLRNL